MRKIKNELGEEVVAVGGWDSPARMRQKYCKTINILINEVILSTVYDYGCLKVIAIENNVENGDIPLLLSAVHFYTKSLYDLHFIAP